MAVCLVYRDTDPERFERAIVRWHALLGQHARAMGARESQLALAALQALRGPAAAPVARLLSELCALYELSASAEGDAVVDAEGAPCVLRGFGLGGWMNMENFITGYPAHRDRSMRGPCVARCSARSGPSASSTASSTCSSPTRTPRSCAGLGVNCVRIPFNYRHFEDDDRPSRSSRGGLPAARPRDRALRRARHLQRSSTCTPCPARRTSTGTATTPPTWPSFWRHRHFQDRVVHLWEAIAERYSGQSVGRPDTTRSTSRPTPSGEVVGPFYDRLVAAIRAVDPDHVLFLDGNSYSTEFSIVRRAATRTRSSLPRLRAAGLRRRRPVSRRRPGRVGSTATQLEETFLAAHRFQRETGHADLDRRVRPGLHRRPGARRAALPDPRATSSRSTTSTTPAGRSGPTRTSACRGSSTPRPTPVHAPLRRPFIAQEGAARRRLVGLDRPGDPGRRRADRTADRARVPGLVAVPVEPARQRRRPGAPHPHRPGDGARVRGAVPRTRRDDLDALADSFSLARCVRRARLCDVLASRMGAAGTVA